MKIGIVTLRSGKNVGGLLQAYAMQTILEQMGHKVEFIDYQLPIKNTIRSFISKSPLTTYYKCLDKFNTWRYRNFRNVKWLLNISPIHYKFYQELEINPPIYDYYIVGSDQVWNFSNLLVPFFLLKFVPQNRPKIAYAASMGQCRLNTNLYNDLKNELKTFKAISLREDKSLNFIKTLMGSQCNVQKTIDPTLLISKDYYTKISNKLTKMPSYYMVSYILSNLEKKQIKAIKDAHRAALEYVIRDYSASGQFSQQRAQYAGRIVYAFQKHCLILYNNPAIKQGAYGSGGFRRYFSRMIELGNNIQLLLSALFFQTGKQLFIHINPHGVHCRRSRCYSDEIEMLHP